MNFRGNMSQTITLKERFNATEARRLLLSDLIDSTGKRTLRKYLSKLDNGCVEVAYTNNELGRLEAKMTHLKTGETCATQMRLYNEMKAVGCKGIYTDVDIKNCHPTLLAQLFRQEGCPTKYLDLYVTDRNKLTKEMGVSKKAVKELMFGLIYNSDGVNEKNWMKQHNIAELPPLFSEMQKDGRDVSYLNLTLNLFFSCRMAVVPSKLGALFGTTTTLSFKVIHCRVRFPSLFLSLLSRT